MAENEERKEMKSTTKLCAMCRMHRTNKLPLARRSDLLKSKANNQYKLNIKEQHQNKADDERNGFNGI